ncbi:AAA family ATPase [Tissierella sp.]|uniref:ATP-dependent nuclease n=1 Tax=Tissierella sp. TaxID=41274 RepID=UPI0030615334
MSKVRIESIEVENYRSFGERQRFEFPGEEYKKPIAIIGYNNVGKTNLMNAILYGVGERYVQEKTFELKDIHNLDKDRRLFIRSQMGGSSYGIDYYGKDKTIAGTHTITCKLEDGELYSEIAKGESFFGANKHYNIFYINFHNIKDEISTQKTSWGNLTSFLAKHIQKLVDSDGVMATKKTYFKDENDKLKEEILDGSKLNKFIDSIKENYSVNLRDNNCMIDFGLPDYEDIFLKMIFKIGLNGNMDSPIPLEHFGDGYISMFVMAVIQAIAETEIDDKCLFLFEEPESFLHANHQEYFYKRVLCNLANRGHQVIYTTHSAKMIDIFDTKSIIKLEFDEDKMQTEVSYNNIGNFDIEDEVIGVAQYNQYIKTIEPNLNKILFSKKVIFVEGPNDVMVYNYVIRKKVYEAYLSKRGYEKNGEIPYDVEEACKSFADTYLNFENIVIIPHHGKSTVFLLVELCKHFNIDYFVITDWDLYEDFIGELSKYKHESDMKKSHLYKEASSNKGIITTNWKIISSVGLDNIHYNIPRLEEVIGYENNDKDSLNIWKKLNETDEFSTNLFSSNLEKFIGLNNIKP